MRTFLLNKTVGGILLVAGVTIGAGMLALPITAGLDGFTNAAILLCAVYLFMLFSLFVSFEVSLYSEKPDANIITNTRQYLGISAQILAWGAFLLLLYAVCAAYISGGGSLIARLFELAGWPYQTKYLGTSVFVILFGGMVFCGARTVDVVNKLFMFGLIAAFAFLLFFISPHVKLENLQYTGKNDYYALITLPIVILSFTSHVILPTLRHYLNSNVSQLKHVLLWGSLLPLICYLIWDFLILGIFPAEGASGLIALAHAESPVERMTVILQENFGLPAIALAVGLFSFCALITSFFAVLISLMDFLADGLKIRKSLDGRIITALISIVPPVVFALFFPHAFLTAISYAGIFIAILYGILPAWMAWRVRYILKLPIQYQAPFGKLGLIVLFLGAVFIIILDLGTTLEFINL